MSDYTYPQRNPFGAGNPRVQTQQDINNPLRSLVDHLKVAAVSPADIQNNRNVALRPPHPSFPNQRQPQAPGKNVTLRTILATPRHNMQPPELRFETAPYPVRFYHNHQNLGSHQYPSTFQNVTNSNEPRPPGVLMSSPWPNVTTGSSFLHPNGQPQQSPILMVGLQQSSHDQRYQYHINPPLPYPGGAAREDCTDDVNKISKTVPAPPQPTPASVPPAISTITPPPQPPATSTTTLSSRRPPFHRLPPSCILHKVNSSFPAAESNSQLPISSMPNPRNQNVTNNKTHPGNVQNPTLPHPKQSNSLTTVSNPSQHHHRHKDDTSNKNDAKVSSLLHGLKEMLQVPKKNSILQRGNSPTEHLIEKNVRKDNNEDNVDKGTGVGIAFPMQVSHPEIKEEVIEIEEDDDDCQLLSVDLSNRVLSLRRKLHGSMIDLVHVGTSECDIAQVKTEKAKSPPAVVIETVNDEECGEIDHVNVQMEDLPCGDDVRSRQSYNTMGSSTSPDSTTEETQCTALPSERTANEEGSDGLVGSQQNDQQDASKCVTEKDISPGPPRTEIKSGIFIGSQDVSGAGCSHPSEDGEIYILLDSEDEAAGEDQVLNSSNQSEIAGGCTQGVISRGAPAAELVGGHQGQGEIVCGVPGASDEMNVHVEPTGFQENDDDGMATSAFTALTLLQTIQVKPQPQKTQSKEQLSREEGNVCRPSESDVSSSQSQISDKIEKSSTTTENVIPESRNSSNIGMNDEEDKDLLKRSKKPQRKRGRKSGHKQKAVQMGRDEDKATSAVGKRRDSENVTSKTLDGNHQSLSVGKKHMRNSFGGSESATKTDLIKAVDNNTETTSVDCVNMSRHHPPNTSSSAVSMEAPNGTGPNDNRVCITPQTRNLVTATHSVVTSPGKNKISGSRSEDNDSDDSCSLSNDDDNEFLDSSGSFSSSESSEDDADVEYRCKLCSKSFHRRSHLKKHMKNHYGGKVEKIKPKVQCKACRRKFLDDTALQAHLLHRRYCFFDYFHIFCKSNSNSVKTCKMCGKVAAKWKDLKKHSYRDRTCRLRFTNIIIERTKNIGKTQPDSTQQESSEDHEHKRQTSKQDKPMTKHLHIEKEISSESVKKTEDVPADTSSSSDHHQPNRLEHSHFCHFCKKQFKTPVSFRDHLNRLDACKQFYLRPENKCPVKSNYCPSCNIFMSSNSKLRTHICCGKSTVKCTVCSKTFGSNMALRQHMKMSSCKPSICKDSKSTNRKGQSKFGLIKKKEDQNQNRLEPCDTVPSFPLDKPSKESKFECIVCKAIFNTVQLLLDHSYSHTEEGQFLCQQCSMVFKRYNSLVSHMIWHKRLQNVKMADLPVNSAKVKSTENSSTVVHSCPDCPLKYKDEGKYNSHVRNHQLIKEYKGLKKREMNKTPVKYMKSEVNDATCFACCVCGQKFSTLNGRNYHVENNCKKLDGQQGSVNKLSATTNNDNGGRKAEMLQKLKSTFSKCSLCARFLKKESFKSHMASHKKKMVKEMKMKGSGSLTAPCKAICPICKKTLSCKKILILHFNRHGHKDIMKETKHILAPKNNRITDKSAPGILGLNKRSAAQKIAKQTYDFSCKICGKKFSNISASKFHLKVAHKIMESKGWSAYLNCLSASETNTLSETKTVLESSGDAPPFLIPFDKAKKPEKVSCEICKKVIQKRSLMKHMHEVHGLPKFLFKVRRKKSPAQQHGSNDDNDKAMMIKIPWSNASNVHNLSSTCPGQSSSSPSHTQSRIEVDNGGADIIVSHQKAKSHPVKSQGFLCRVCNKTISSRALFWQHQFQHVKPCSIKVAKLEDIIKEVPATFEAVDHATVIMDTIGAGCVMVGHGGIVGEGGAAGESGVVENMDVVKNERGESEVNMANDNVQHWYPI